MIHALKAVCVLLGAMSWAVASVLLFRFGSSVFRNLNPKFWNPAISSKAAKQIGGLKLDAFHIFQGIALAFLFMGIIIPADRLVLFGAWYFDLPIQWAAISIIWVIGFPVTYGKLSPYH